MLVIAALAALAVVIKAVVDAQYTEEEAARDAAKSVENLTNRYKELADAANEFRDTQTGYKDALKACKYGRGSADKLHKAQIYTHNNE